MDNDELQLPALPQRLAQPQLARPAFLRLNSRKRSTRSDELTDDDALSTSLHTSSDPALFSSDENPDAENYSGAKRRKKKTYAGTWWGERTRAGSRGLSGDSNGRVKKRAFTRNYDSGIFMNSDDGTSSGAEFSSDSSFGNDLMEAQKREDEEQSQLTPKARIAPRTPVMGASKLALRFGSASPVTPRAARREPTLQEARDNFVMGVVRKCLDESKENVDLCGLELDSLPPDVRELATMVNNEPTSQMHFDSLVARPRLFLSNNLFRTFPTPLLELRNLRYLSLFRNKLTRLPPGIRNLQKLETLHIANNKLQTLPVEVLDLLINGRLLTLMGDPNPWLVPTDEQREAAQRKSRIPDRLDNYSVPKFHDTRPDDCTLALSLIATSEPRPLAKISGELGSVSRQRMPSLSELVLRQLSILNATKRSLAPLMPEGTPARIMDNLADLHVSQSEGNRHCMGCKRLYVRAAETWVEWWDVKVVKRYGSGRGGIVGASERSGHVVPFEVGVCGQCC